MVTDAQNRLQSRIVRAAEAALAERKVVSPIDVLIGVGWLASSEVDRWRQGRIPYLEAAARVNLGKLSTAMKYFRGWARDRGLRPSETAYVARTRDRRSLRFSKSGAPEIERAYRTHWVSSELSPKKRQRVAERQSRSPDLVVIWHTGRSPARTVANSARGCSSWKSPDHCVWPAPTWTTWSSYLPATPRSRVGPSSGVARARWW